ncbi:MAG: nucleotide exchange factor GrpE [Alistipes sp.]|nr:nucleotide exchange factor GrpE [Alistipes sp.]
MTHKKMKEKSVDTESVKDETLNESPATETPEVDSDSDTLAADAEDINAKMAEMTAAAAQWQDKYMRLSAEFDNYRKRTLKEKMDLIATGGEDVIKSLLSVMDDIDRAMDAMVKTDDVTSIRKGITLIHQKLMDTLRAKGVEEIEAVGQALDTDLHEAVAKFPAEEEQKGKIIDVVQKGYKLKDKVVRYVKVVVGE